MAGTVTYQMQMRLGNGNLADSYSTSSLSSTQATALLVRNVQVIPFGPGSQVALDLGSVTTPGWAVFSNLDVTNYVEVGIVVAATFYPFLRLGPGTASPAVAGDQSGPIKLSPGVVLYALANTGAVSLFYIVYNA